MRNTVAGRNSMTYVTVTSLAAEIHTPVDRLIQQLADAGIEKSATDFITYKEKEILLAHLKRDRGNELNKLTLQRKTRSTLNIPSNSGKSKSVQIEIRKKRTYVQQRAQEVKRESIEQKLINIKSESVAQHQYKDLLDQDNMINKSDNCAVDLQVKHTPENKVKSKSRNQVKSISRSFVEYKVIKSRHTLDRSLNQINKTGIDIKAAEIICKTEEEIKRNIEEKARLAAEEVRRMVVDNEATWMANNINIEEDTSDYHFTTSHHARQAEDDNDRKVEGQRRTRTRGGKIAKNKKTSRMSEFKADREEARAAVRGVKNKRKTNPLMHIFNKPEQAVTRDVMISETITVAELANKMAVKGSQVIKSIMKLGAMVTINQVIDQETAQLVAEEMGHKVILRRENDLEESVMNDRDTGHSSTAEYRAPVVTIMGHVDHGKTSIIDYIRVTKVAANESGGITQHIGAYHVETENGMITIMDTPGHAAFTAMRARGAHATDIIVLVVAADDGVMPQTIESIQHAKASEVPIIVAINKIDKPEADPDRIKKELTKYDLVPEEWGGDSQFINVSARSGVGIEELLNAILLQAEILELKAIRTGMASGVVIESYLDKGRGPVATVLIREGTLNLGDIVLCGLEYGRIRAMRNAVGRNISTAGPSVPVEILGLSGIPAAGDKATVVRDDKKAREVAFYRQGKFREVKLARQQKYKLENIFANMNSCEVSELNIVLKSDVHGSTEAIKYALEKLSTPEVKVKIIESGVGGITETDATLAAASNAIILGFNVRADASARRVIEAENIDIRYYSVIYDLINEVKQAMRGMLTLEYKQEIIGLAKVRNLFRSPKFGVIAGCMVIEGVVKRHNKIRVLRDNVVIYEGELESLRRFKDDVKEVRNGMECGIGIKNYNDLLLEDVIEVFETIAIQRDFEI